MHIGQEKEAIFVERIGSPAQPKKIEAPKVVPVEAEKVERELVTA